MSNFENEQEKKQIDVKWNKLADVLNKAGEQYHPDFKWTTGGDGLYFIDENNEKGIDDAEMQKLGCCLGVIGVAKGIPGARVSEKHGNSSNDKIPQNTTPLARFCLPKNDSHCEATGVNWQPFGDFTKQGIELNAINGKDIDVTIVNAEKYYANALEKYFGNQTNMIKRIKGNNGR